jgi:hypothetical protein
MTPTFAGVVWAGAWAVASEANVPMDASNSNIFAKVILIFSDFYRLN